MFADHVDFASRRPVLRSGNLRDINGEVEHDTSPNPRIVNAGANTHHAAASIRSADVWVLRFNARQTTPDPQVKVIEGACFGGHKEFAGSGDRFRKIE
jgi:hypothetical protein